MLKTGDHLGILAGVTPCLAARGFTDPRYLGSGAEGIVYVVDDRRRLGRQRRECVAKVWLDDTLSVDVWAHCFKSGGRPWLPLIHDHFDCELTLTNRDVAQPFWITILEKVTLLEDAESELGQTAYKYLEAFNDWANSLYYGLTMSKPEPLACQKQLAKHANQAMKLLERFKLPLPNLQGGWADDGHIVFYDLI